MRTLNNIVVALTLVSIIGCASTKREEEAASFAKNEQPKSGDIVVVVPIGQVVPEFTASDATAKLSGPFAFGLIGALVGAAIDAAISNTNNSLTEQSQVTAAAVETRIEEYLAKKLVENLSTCEINAKYHGEVLSQGPISWDQKSEPVIQKLDPSLKGSKYFIEAGVINMNVTGGFKDPRVCIKAAGLVFKTDSNALVNKLRTPLFDDVVSCTAMDGAEVGTQAKFNELKAATKKSLDDIAVKLSDAVCKKVPVAIVKKVE